MVRPWWWLVVLVLATAVTSARDVACSVGPGGALVFQPSFIVVAPGDAIVFRFQTRFHTVDSVADESSCAATGFFSSGAPNTGPRVWAYNVSAAAVNGTVWHFVCRPHCSSGMRGVILVLARDEPLPVTPPPTGGSRPALLVAHAVLMSVGFGLLLFVAVFAASITYPPMWEVVRSFGAAATLVVLAGFVCVLVQVDQAGRPHFAFPDSVTSNAHPILGVIIISVLLAQSVYSTVVDQLWQARRRRLKAIPQPDALDRVFFWVGRAIVLLSVVQMFLGIAEFRLPSWVFAVYAFYFAAWLLLLLVACLWTRIDAPMNATLDHD